MAANCWNRSLGPLLQSAATHHESAGHASLRAALILVSSSFASIALAGDINGRWMTFDPSSGDKRSIVEIKNLDNQYTGRIVDLFTAPGEPLDPACGLCPGGQQGQKIRGMEILSLSKAESEVAYTGKILDPEEGQSYKCIVTLDATGDRMTIRGYVGIPLLGRNVVWQRVK
jgi:uncharacterized protein (DUF2147 family)